MTQSERLWRVRVKVTHNGETWVSDKGLYAKWALDSLRASIHRWGYDRVVVLAKECRK